MFESKDMLDFIRNSFCPAVIVLQEAWGRKRATERFIGQGIYP
jgi:hypothetical protein